MGTRADFYVGTGDSAEWLGSVAWDGYEWKEKACPLRDATSEEEYRAAVEGIMNSRPDATRPEKGWPWPWNDSNTTDEVYYWNGHRTRWDGDTRDADGERTEPRLKWPDMSSRKNVRWDIGSGLVVI